MSSNGYFILGQNALRIVVVVISFAAVSCSQSGDSPQADYPLGVMDFDFARLGEDEASQVSAARAIGFTGLTLRTALPEDLEKLERYQAAVVGAPFKIYAGWMAFHIDKNLEQQHAKLDKIIQGLKQSDSALWLFLHAKTAMPEREEIVAFLRSVAERTKAAGVELVMYPHANTVFETAEEALPYVEEAQNGNLFISLHLCHEIRAGNGDRLDEVAAKIGPLLRLPSINGADKDAVNEEGNTWDRGIQPMAQGDYDSSKLLRALKSAGYKGPVLLQTAQLEDEAITHHQTSFNRFQEMVDELED